MSYFDGFDPAYTFSLQIGQEDKTILDATISAMPTVEDIARAKESILRLLNDYTPVVQAPIPAEPAKTEALQSDVALYSQTQDTHAQRKEPEGAKGLLQLCCPACGNVFGTFLRERQNSIACKCSHSIDLTTPLARYRFTCPSCQHEGYGQTNLEDPEITVPCKCRADVKLRWVPAVKEYRN